MDQIKTGAFLTQLRKEKNLTQEQVAEKISVSPQAISKWEVGKSLPDITMLPLLSSLYSASIDEILAGERNPKDVVACHKDYSYLVSPIAGMLYGIIALLLYIGLNAMFYISLGNYHVIYLLNLYNVVFGSIHYQYGNYLLLFAFIATCLVILLSAPLFFPLSKKASLVIDIIRNCFISIQDLFLIFFLCACQPLPTGDYIVVIVLTLMGLAFWLVPYLNPAISNLYQKRNKRSKESHQ
jgi:transcriptional regulator with XRE-family HTH domain